MPRPWAADIASGLVKLRFSGDLRVGRAEDIDDRAVSGEGKSGATVPGMSLLIRCFDFGVSFGDDLTSFDPDVDWCPVPPMLSLDSKAP